MDRAAHHERARASTTSLTGWFLAKAWSQPGIDATGTKADEAKMKGNRIGNAMTWAVSAVGGREADGGEAPAERVGVGQQQQGAAEEVGRRWSRCGSRRRSPPPVMRTTTKTLRHRSAVVRPARTADRAMGRARKRSINPLCRSSARPTAVLTAPKHDRLHEDARHHVVDVLDAAGMWMAPPKT